MKLVKVSDLKKGDYFKTHVRIENWTFQQRRTVKEYDVIGKLKGMGTKTPSEVMLRYVDMMIGKRMRLPRYLNDDIFLLTREEVDLMRL